MKDINSLYKTMLLIRRFEEHLLLEFTKGKIVGTTHSYIGQEADAAGIFSAIDKDDICFSNHRCHGHFLAYGGDPHRLAAELMGKATGVVGGRGGSQHIQWRKFYSNGIQGGIVPVATGMALAEKVKQTGNIAVVFIGDGTLGEGALYESMNISALWTLPLLTVVEDNHYAQTTPIKKGVAGSIAGRFTAFGISVFEGATVDVLEVRELALQACQYVRSGSGPACLLLHTNRFSAHSTGDDHRSSEELAIIRRNDPLQLHATRLDPKDLEYAELEIANIVNLAFGQAEADPYPSLDFNE